MTNEELHSQIKQYLEQHGASGVNQLQKHIGIPLSTLQKFLDKQQSYFKKNEQRKWVLPEQANIKEQEVLTDSFAIVVQNQVNSLKAQVNILMSTINNTVSLIETQQSIAPPVAEKEQRKLDSRFYKLQEQVDNLPKIIKSKKENIPEELLEILLNTKWLDLFLDLGNNYCKEYVEPALYDLLSGKLDYMDEDVLTTIKDYQKE